MTPAETQAYHLSYVRWLTRQQRVAVGLVRASLLAVADHVADSINRTTPAVTLSLLDSIIRPDQLTATYVRLYEHVGTLSAQQQYNALMVRKATTVGITTKDRDTPDLSPKPGGSSLLTIAHHSQQWRLKMAQLARSSETARRIVQVTAVTKQKVRDVLTRGAEGGWAVSKLVKKLRSVIADPARALLIALTETTRAASVGAEAGAMSTGLVLDKQWIATPDTRTRDAHRAMIGSKPIPRDELFTVDGAKMRYPGDPAGGARNTVRCRCAVVYVPRTNPFE